MSAAWQPPLPDISRLQAIVAEHEAEVTAQGPNGSSYGDTFADIYDNWYHEPTRERACVDRLLALLAASTSVKATSVVLELGAGTGLLTRRLLRTDRLPSDPTVIGLDLSARMLHRFASRSAGIPIRGDLTRPPLRDQSVDLAYCSYNTLFNVLDPVGQERSFTEAARILRPQGYFAMETIRPEVLLSDTTDSVAFSRFSPLGTVWSVARHEPSEQLLSGYFITDTSPPVVRPWRLRYASTDELDFWAGQASLTLVERSADWHGQEVHAHDDRQVSLWQRI